MFEPVSGKTRVFEPVPKEMTASLHKVCEGMLTYMEKAGNSKQLVSDVLETVLDHLQADFMDNADKFDLRTANSINIDMIMLTAMTRVLMNNPMYGSHALTLQMRNELSRILDGAEGFKLGG